ncbi:hypothetical protein BDV12DRAFT_168159 [Aspergillus spectabilis]
MMTLRQASPIYAPHGQLSATETREKTDQSHPMMLKAQTTIDPGSEPGKAVQHLLPQNNIHTIIHLKLVIHRDSMRYLRPLGRPSPLSPIRILSLLRWRYFNNTKRCIRIIVDISV